ncbi:hypothetical protein EK21DRAFT_85180 [Setomelanomma holmii]|uniref:Uncharacterized protein n=1 Tax=Setomelanomma holmii TaxID=210430 RepID=A0A9P4HIE1_9PLEO|nr:hypothetical protein EK21DRAFT_85180 [Setomelanomma holmii]
MRMLSSLCACITFLILLLISALRRSRPTRFGGTMARPLMHMIDYPTLAKILHDYEGIPETPVPVDGVAPPTTEEIERWCKLFDLLPEEAEFWVCAQRRDFPDLAISLQIHVGAVAANIRGRIELAFIKDVDLVKPRLDWVPEIGRTIPPRTHFIIDTLRNRKEVFVLRSWEAMLLRRRLPNMISMNGEYYETKLETISLFLARKQLLDGSRNPCLPDPTLPQHRLDQNEIPRPLQDELPVWYFLTGHMTHPYVLRALLRLDHEPPLRHATVHGLWTDPDHDTEVAWACESQKIDYMATSTEGVAYLVTDKLTEGRLRYLKSNLYEVRRCKIVLHTLFAGGQEQEVAGLTFTSIGGFDAVYEMIGVRDLQIENHPETDWKQSPFANVVLPVPERWPHGDHIFKVWLLSEWRKIPKTNGKDFFNRAEAVRESGVRYAPPSRLYIATSALDPELPSSPEDEDLDLHRVKRRNPWSSSSRSSFDRGEAWWNPPKDGTAKVPNPMSRNDSGTLEVDDKASSPTIPGVLDELDHISSSMRDVLEGSVPDAPSLPERSPLRPISARTRADQRPLAGSPTHQRLGLSPVYVVESGVETTADRQQLMASATSAGTETIILESLTRGEDPTSGAQYGTHEEQDLNLTEWDELGDDDDEEGDMRGSHQERSLNTLGAVSLLIVLYLMYAGMDLL